MDEIQEGIVNEAQGRFNNLEACKVDFRHWAENVLKFKKPAEEKISISGHINLADLAMVVYYMNELLQIVKK